MSDGNAAVISLSCASACSSSCAVVGVSPNVTDAIECCFDVARDRRLIEPHHDPQLDLVFERRQLCPAGSPDLCIASAA